MTLKLYLIILFISPYFSFGQKEMLLYDTPIPGALPLPGEEEGDSNAIRNVSQPTLSIYLPTREETTRTAVIICPGGGYGVLVLEREGTRIAKALAENGIVSFVLKYRLPDKNRMKTPQTAPLQDAQQAIMKVRTIAQEYNIDVGKVGMIGFSAGGHLVATAGTHLDKEYINNQKGINLKPDFLILVYPVISFQKGLVHEGTMHNLLGQSPNRRQKKYYSNELQVTPATPPTFLVHGADDKSVPAMNSIQFFESLQRNGVPSELHIYSKADHGFFSYPTLQEWLGRSLRWMRRNNFISGFSFPE